MVPIVQFGLFHNPEEGTALTRVKPSGSISSTTKFVVGFTPRDSTEIVNITVSPSKKLVLFTVLLSTMSELQLYAEIIEEL
jgi:hypothetical protein